MTQHSTPRPGDIGDALTKRPLDQLSTKELIAEWEKAFTDCVYSNHLGPDFDKYQLVRREIARRLGKVEAA